MYKVWFKEQGLVQGLIQGFVQVEVLQSLVKDLVQISYNLVPDPIKSSLGWYKIIKSLVQVLVIGLGTRIQGVLQSTWSGICHVTSSSKRVGSRIGRSLHSILEVITN